MTKVLAYAFVVVWGLLNLLGNFWFTYGIWPKDWSMFLLFGASHLCAAAAAQAILKDN